MGFISKNSVPEIMFCGICFYNNHGDHVVIIRTIYKGLRKMKCVFIVEDHEEIRLLYSVILNRLENVRICGEGDTAEDALERIPDLHPDLVLIDISLPGMDGIELVEKLKRIDPKMKFLIVSGHDPERFELAAKAAGADEIIGKGDIMEITSAVKSVLEI